MGSADEAIQPRPKEKKLPALTSADTSVSSASRSTGMFNMEVTGKCVLIRIIDHADPNLKSMPTHKDTLSSKPVEAPRLKRKAEPVKSSQPSSSSSKPSTSKFSTISSESLLITPALCLEAAVVAKKGASLANPSKKARKYQAMEFGSDED
jgi:hypothetical protein